MDFSVVSSVEMDHVRLTVQGMLCPERMFEFIDYVKAASDKARLNKVLIDCSAMGGSLTETDRFHGGIRIAEVWGSAIRAALVMPPGQVTKLGEIAAANRGATFLVTESMDEAIEWLQGP
ncbi:MAG TPA: STAS/SEC14 domain-containing protein [Pyrinomonadaceae bacterium]|nr:STAS/SEC14 domain-containing protein [Pyrinomonadaceae bacterium]